MTPECRASGLAHALLSSRDHFNFGASTHKQRPLCWSILDLNKGEQCAMKVEQLNKLMYQALC